MKTVKYQNKRFMKHLDYFFKNILIKQELYEEINNMIKIRG